MNTFDASDLTPAFGIPIIRPAFRIEETFLSRITFRHGRSVAGAAFVAVALIAFSFLSAMNASENPNGTWQKVDFQITSLERLPVDPTNVASGLDTFAVGHYEFKGGTVWTTSEWMKLPQDAAPGATLSMFGTATGKLSAYSSSGRWAQSPLAMLFAVVACTMLLGYLFMAVNIVPADDEDLADYRIGSIDVDSDLESGRGAPLAAPVSYEAHRRSPVTAGR